MSKLAALKKILGELGTGAKGLGSMGADVGRQIGRESGAVMRGLGEAGDGLRRTAKLPRGEMMNGLKYDASQLGGVLGKNKLGASALGAGAVAGAGAGAYGIKEALEAMGVLDDEDEDNYRRR